ncbi:MAG: CHASE2 domain-containing protein, partial [bacterium]
MKHYRDKMLQALAKKWPILAICATIIGLSYYTLISHYFRLSRVVAEVGKQDALYTIESTIFDWKINLRGPVTQPTQVGILAIDEKTLKQFGSWPFSRRYYEQAFRNLKSLGVKWIGYDVIFADDEVAGLPDIESALEAMAASADPKTVQASLELIQAAQATSPGDRSFRAGMEAFQNIVMGYFYFATKKEADLNLGQGQRFEGMEQIANSAIQGIDMPKGRRLEDYLITKAHGLVGNTDYLNHATTHFAFFNNDADDDAINRWITLVANIDGQLMPSLGLKTVAEYLNREIFVFFNDNG